MNPEGPSSAAVRSEIVPFRLNKDRFAKHLIEQCDEPFGFSSHDERGFANAIVSRFDDAIDAAAVGGSPDLLPVIYPVSSGSLIVAVRERNCPARVGAHMRQLATLAFEASEVACQGDERFDECCAAIAALLDIANSLLPVFAALRRSEGDPPPPELRAHVGVNGSG